MEIKTTDLKNLKDFESKLEILKESLNQKGKNIYSELDKIKETTEFKRFEEIEQRVIFAFLARRGKKPRQDFKKDNPDFLTIFNKYNKIRAILFSKELEEIQNLTKEVKISKNFNFLKFKIRSEKCFKENPKNDLENIQTLSIEEEENLQKYINAQNIVDEFKKAKATEKVVIMSRIYGIRRIKFNLNKIDEEYIKFKNHEIQNGAIGNKEAKNEIELLRMIIKERKKASSYSQAELDKHFEDLNNINKKHEIRTRQLKVSEKVLEEYKRINNQLNTNDIIIGKTIESTITPDKI